MITYVEHNSKALLSLALFYFEHELLVPLCVCFLTAFLFSYDWQSQRCTFKS